MRCAGGVDLAVSRDWRAYAIVEDLHNIYYVRVLDAAIPPKGGKIDLTIRRLTLISKLALRSGVGQL